MYIPVVKYNVAMWGIEHRMVHYNRNVLLLLLLLLLLFFVVVFFLGYNLYKCSPVGKNSVRYQLV